MWRWIGGIFVIIVLCLAGAIWSGYRKLTTGGDIATVMIAGSPDRVYAALANHDSLANWWVLRGNPPPMGHGPLAVGDSLPAQTARAAARQRLSSWVVDEVVPGKLLVLSLRSDTAHIVVAVRRDSLTAYGDSTEVVSTIASPMMANFSRDSAGSIPRSGSTMISMSSKLVVSAMRLQSKVELTRLKNHIEGRALEAQP